MSGQEAASSDSTTTEYGYDANFVPELERRYACPVCLVAMRDPVQTKCGHRFCKPCLKSSTGNLRFSKCPVDNTWFDTTKDVFVDNATRREVLSLTVNCSNHEADCSWQGELRQLQGHMEQCPEAIVDCPNGCPSEQRRRELTSHLTSCPLRLEPCSHCQAHVQVNDLAKHQLLVCPKFPVNCGVCGEVGILREDIARHVDLLNGDCPFVTVKCAFSHVGCYFQDKRQNMVSHHENATHHHMMLMSARMTLHDEKLHQHERHLVDILKKCTDLRHMTERCHRQLEEQNRQLSSQMDRLSELESTSFNGQLMWKISLPDTNQCQVWSPAFYTGLPGYKLRVCLELAGYREGDEIFASVFVAMENGSHDDQLRFPFDGTCYVTLFDQSDSAEERSNHKAKIVCSKVPRCTGEGFSESGRRGLLKFMRTSDLLQGRFARRGSLIMQVQVTHFMPHELNIAQVQ